MPCLIERITREFIDAYQGWTATLCNERGFRDADYPTWSCDAPVLTEQPRPIPGTQVAHAEALIDQIKIVIGKFEQTQGVHRVKLNPITNLLGFGLGTCILYHPATYVHSYQVGQRWVGPGCFNEPTPGPAADIEHPLKDRRVRLLWEHSAHARGSHLILDRHTGEFVLIGAILHKIGAGMLSTRVCGIRHGLALLTCILDAGSCLPSVERGTHLLELYLSGKAPVEGPFFFIRDHPCISSSIAGWGSSTNSPVRTIRGRRGVGGM